MLNQTTPMPTIAVSNLAEARKFYEEVLGLEVESEMPEAELVTYESGSGGLQIYVSDEAGTNQATYATWDVGDINAIVKSLKSKGVDFEHYPDMPEVTVEGDVHVWPGQRAAWFKDPDGNVLCLHQVD